MRNLVIFILLMATVSANAMLISPTKTGSPINMDDGTYIGDNIYYLGTYDLGNIAPSQELRLVFSRNTGPGGSESEASIFWETAETTVPREVEISGGQMRVSIMIPNEKRGKYRFNLTLLGSEVQTITPHNMIFEVNVKEDVFDFEFDDMYYIDAGETTTIRMKVKSRSAGHDILSFTDTEGIPSGWVVVNDLEIGPFEERNVLIKMTPNEEGMFYAQFKATRQSSNLVDVNDMTFRVYPTFSAKMKAFGEGFSIIPILFQPFYSLLAMFGLA